MWELTVRLNHAYDSLPQAKRLRLFLAILSTMLTVPCSILIIVLAVAPLSFDMAVLYIYGPTIIGLLMLILARSAYVFRW